MSWDAVKALDGYVYIVYRSMGNTLHEVLLYIDQAASKVFEIVYNQTGVLTFIGGLDAIDANRELIDYEHLGIPEKSSPTHPKSCNCEMITLLKSGCICGAITRYSQSPNIKETL